MVWTYRTVRLTAGQPPSGCPRSRGGRRACRAPVRQGAGVPRHPREAGHGAGDCGGSWRSWTVECRWWSASRVTARGTHRQSHARASRKFLVHGYAGADVVNKRDTIAGIAVATTKLYRLRLLMAARNARTRSRSSSSWAAFLVGSHAGEPGGACRPGRGRGRRRTTRFQSSRLCGALLSGSSGSSLLLGGLLGDLGRALGGRREEAHLASPDHPVSGRRVADLEPLLNRSCRRAALLLRLSPDGGHVSEVARSIAPWGRRLGPLLSETLCPRNLVLVHVYPGVGWCLLQGSGNRRTRTTTRFVSRPRRLASSPTGPRSRSVSCWPGEWANRVSR